MDKQCHIFSKNRSFYPYMYSCIDSTILSTWFYYRFTFDNTTNLACINRCHSMTLTVLSLITVSLWCLMYYLSFHHWNFFVFTSSCMYVKRKFFLPFSTQTVLKTCPDTKIDCKKWIRCITNFPTIFRKCDTRISLILTCLWIISSFAILIKVYDDTWLWKKV